MKNSVKMVISSVFLLITLVAGPSALAQDKTVNDGVLLLRKWRQEKLSTILHVPLATICASIEIR